MKPLFKDYLLSFAIYLVVLGLLLLYSVYKDHFYTETTSHFYNVSQTITKSKASGKFLGRYMYDSAQSNSVYKLSKYDSTLWFEKLSSYYYRNTKQGNVLVADSVYKDTVMGNLDAFFNQVTSGLTWLDKRTGDTLWEGSSGSVVRLKHYPDSLLILETTVQPVYKGTICLTRE